MIFLIILINFIAAQVDQITTHLDSIQQASDPTEMSKAELKKYQDEVNALYKEVLSGANQILSTQALDTQQVVLSNSLIQIKTIKASLDYLDKLLYLPPKSMSGQTESAPLNFSSSQEFNIVIQYYQDTNLFKFYPQFPYPQQKCKTIITDITNLMNPVLPRPFQYLFDTNLQFDGDPYDEGNVNSLETFMEQTRYLTCIVGTFDPNSTKSWNNDCQQQTLVHPNGKVLIECDCFNLSSPIALINDTSYLYQRPPKIEITYVIVYRSAIFWIIVFMTVLWSLFSISGAFRDKVTSRRLGKSPSRVLKLGMKRGRSPTKRHTTQVKVIEPKTEAVIDTKEQLPIEIDVEQMQQESKNNSMVVKFEDLDAKDAKDTASKKKKRKKKLQFKTSFTQSNKGGGINQSNSQINQDQSVEPIMTQQQETKRDILPKGYAKSEQFQNVLQDQIEEDQQNDYQNDEDDEDDDMDEEDDEDLDEDEGFEDDSKMSSQKVEQQKPQQIEKQDDQGLKEIILEIPRSQSRQKSLSVVKQKDKDKDKDKKDDKQEDQKVVDPFPLPPITFQIFLHIFLRYHELFSIFYYYKVKESRLSRFVVNHTKNMFVLGICGFFAQLFPFGYTVIIMFVGLLIANGIEQVATILLKQKKCFFQFLGILLLSAMMGLSIFLFINGFTDLLPPPHEIWLWTFVIIYLSELILIELLLIGSKVFLQPWLRSNNSNTSPLYLPLFAIFWDKKVQRIIRSQHRARINKLSIMKQQL